MSDNGGFVDLRVGHGPRGIGDDSVWPSFTDIMTVIVMIFLMALAIMMVRNFELDRQLVTTANAREASLLENRELVDKLNTIEFRMRGLESENQALTERTEALKARNIALDKERGQAQARVADLTAGEARLSRELAALNDQFSALELRSGSEIDALNSANLSLSEQLDTVAAELRQVRSLLENEQQHRRALDARVEEQNRELIAKQALLERLQLIQQESAQRYADASVEIDELNELIRRRQTENAALQKLAEASGAKFRSLQEEYESLDAKYRSLARPARSAAGKYVVDVRLTKAGDEYLYQLKAPSQSAATYTKAELQRRLTKLKAQQGANLYTRVVIPENNQLSHNEAWQFTQEILQGYDYYYQEYPDSLGNSSAVQ